MRARQLILVRHAKAGWGGHGITTDFDRELTPSGCRDAAALGMRLLPLIPRPDAIVTSPAPRALTTATLLSAAWPDAPPLTIEADLYDAPLGGPAACVSDFDDAWNTVILVGHNPSISHCADWLIGEPTVLELPTAGVVLLKLACSHWHDVAPGCGQLQSLEALEVEVLAAAAGPQASTPVRTPRIGS